MDDVSLSADDPAQPGAAPATAPRAHRRVLADFFQGRSRASYKRSWNVDLDDGCGHRDGSDDSEIDDDGDEDDDATQPSQAKRRKCDCRTVLAVHVEAFHAMTLTGSSLKKTAESREKAWESLPGHDTAKHLVGEQHL